MNIKRLMKVLMTLKMVDPKLLAQWTKPEKDRMAYNAKKMEAIEQSFRTVNDDVAALRARLLPIEQCPEDRQQFVRNQLNRLNVTEEDDGAGGDGIIIDRECSVFEQVLEAAEKFVSVVNIARLWCT